jgi:hypothetical protein
LIPDVTLKVATTSSTSPSLAVHPEANCTRKASLSGAFCGARAYCWCWVARVVDRLRLRTDTNSSHRSTNCIRFRPILTFATTSNFSPCLTASTANGSPLSTA